MKERNLQRSRYVRNIGVSMSWRRSLFQNVYILCSIHRTYKTIITKIKKFTKRKKRTDI